MLVEIPDSNLKKAWFEYLEETQSSTEFMKLVIAQAKMLRDWDDTDWTPLKKLVDKEWKHQLELENLAEKEGW